MKLQKERSQVVERLHKYKKASDFLRDYYDEQKLISKAWSYENWARKLKQKKTTVLRTVSGRIPMSEGLVEAFCGYFKFTKENKRYFELIAICEKVQALYPGVNIDLPEIDEHKKANFKLNKVDKMLVPTQWFALPEVQWVLLLFCGNGLKISDVSKIKSFFHKGLHHIDFDEIVKTGLETKILEKRESVIVFKGFDNAYLDARISGLDTAIKRYMSILTNFKAMIELDAKLGRVPAVDNKACNLRIKNERIPEIEKLMDASLKNIYATLEDDAGDTVIDFQFFVAPVATLSKDR